MFFFSVKLLKNPYFILDFCTIYFFCDVSYENKSNLRSGPNVTFVLKPTTNIVYSMGLNWATHYNPAGCPFDATLFLGMTK